MTIYALKPRFQALLRPIAGALYRLGVTANMVTVGAAVGSVGAGALVAWRADARTIFLIIPIWLFSRMALNAIDGMLAREFHQKSVLGGYLNEITDVISDAVLYAPFALVAPFGAFGIGVVVVLSIVTELAGALGPTMGASRRYDGPMGKSDRAFVFGALGLWIGITGSLPPWIGWAVPILVILLGLTVVNRVRAGIGEARMVAQQC
jgi:CDP-diacylglycerol--glycerol-3-phosphate 3-phosphatidyltransferase